MASIVKAKSVYEEIYSNGMWYPTAGYVGSVLRGYDLEMSPCGHEYRVDAMPIDDLNNVECKLCKAILEKAQ